MVSSIIPSLDFSTREFENWRDFVSVAFDVETDSDPNRFEARVGTFQLDDLVICNATLGAQRYIRTSERVRKDDVDHFVLNLYRKGGWRSQTDNGEFDGHTGQICVLDLARQLISDEPESDLVAMFVPRELIEERVPNASFLHGNAPIGPFGQLLADYMNLLSRQLPRLPIGSERELSRATYEMISACLRPSVAHLDAARPTLEVVLRIRAKRYIEDHLQASNLDVDSICIALSVSRRTLFRLFEHEGGIQHYIQLKRLKRIRSILSNPTETRRISEIAAEFGFLRSDHFARSFKHLFGEAARDVRDPAKTGSISHEHDAETGDRDNDDSFNKWIRNL